jgi:hypothetical protein
MSDLSSKYKRELLVQVSPILESSNQTPSNFIQIQHLESFLIFNSNPVLNLETFK